MSERLKEISRTAGSFGCFFLFGGALLAGGCAHERKYAPAEADAGGSNEHRSDTTEPDAAISASSDQTDPTTSASGVTDLTSEETATPASSGATTASEPSSDGEPNTSGSDGGLGEGCASHDACASGLCLAGQCRTPCDGESCGAGQLCSTALPGGAAAGGCVPERPGLCETCEVDDDCPYPGDHCLAYSNGRACGRDCALSACPEGFECVDRDSGVRQCVPKSRDCSCSATNAGAVRPCQSENEVGTCVGEERCDPSAGWVGCTALTPAAELCNLTDDDCNGATDEGFILGGTCTEGAGACLREGTIACMPDGSAACNAVPASPSGELCNGIDDNCNGETDEDFVSQLGLACTITSDNCSQAGNIACLPDGTAGCVAEGQSGLSETCNGMDDDCNGIIDDGYGVGQACSAGIGSCRREGSIVCTGSSSSACSVSEGTPTEELCNGEDDDCDGAVDDSPSGDGAPCLTGQFGICSPGVQTCNGGSPYCSPTGFPENETCGDGIDQDCDGADQGCPSVSGEDCGTAIDISQGGTFAGDLTGLRDDHWACSGPGGGNDAVYTFTLHQDSLVYLDTLGAGFDTVITVEAAQCNGGNNVACKDDSCLTSASQLVTEVLGAGTYYVWIDTWAAETVPGPFNLTYYASPCTDAVALTTDIFTLSGSALVDTTTAPASRGGICGSNSTGPERWFHFTSCPGAQTFSADTCGTAVDTVLYLRSGSCDGAELSCDDDSCGCEPDICRASRLSSNVGQGWHWLAVDGYGESSGVSTLNWSITPQ